MGEWAVPVEVLGRVGGDRLEMRIAARPGVSLSVDALADAFENGLTRALDPPPQAVTGRGRPIQAVQSMEEPSEHALARRRQAARRVRHLRRLRSPGGREPDLPGALRAPAPGTGVGRDRGDRRPHAPRREGHGVGGRRVLPRAPSAPAGPGGDGPCPLLDRRLVDAPERPAHQRLVLPGPDRARPQRQPGQRRRAPHGAGGRRRHLPVDIRLGGDPPPHRAGRPQQPRAHA